MKIQKWFKKFIQEEEGATAVEYAVMIALIIAVCIGTVAILGGKVDDAFSTVNTKLADASNG